MGVLGFEFGWGILVCVLLFLFVYGGMCYCDEWGLVVVY